MLTVKLILYFADRIFGSIKGKLVIKIGKMIILKTIHFAMFFVVRMSMSCR